MNKTRLICTATAIITLAMPAKAGGLLTNTNQSINFLRNPARDATLSIDGVYSNPAGVVFLDQGFHFSVSLQNAHQTRTIHTGYPLFVNNVNNQSAVHEYEGKADAPIIPSIQAAYNRGKWSVQFNFALAGGGGKCEFANGLGSFEKVVAGIPTYANDINTLYATLGAMGLPGMSGQQMGSRYDYQSFMRGRQYYYGFTLGAAYKLSDNLSVYGGVKMLYGTSNYYGYVKNISIESISNGTSTIVPAAAYFENLGNQLNRYAGAMEQAGNHAAAQQLSAYADKAQQLSQGTQDIELNCDQTGWGVAPIIGVDYRLGKLNLAAKYEFKTRMRLKNKAANSLSAGNISMLDTFRDGQQVAEDTPSLLTVGGQYEVTSALRVMAGWHHYFDVDTKQYTKNMLSDTNEYLAGIEYDINKRIQVSAGGQRTLYGYKADGMNDISFNVNSWSVGVGVGVNVTEKVKVNAGYFHTFYGKFNKTEGEAPAVTTNEFTRSNHVFGLGVDFSL